MKKGKNFYEKGLRFACQGDGKCCESRGQYGYVYLSFNDRRRLASHLGLTLTQFMTRYVRKEDGLYQLQYTGKDCPFYHENRCSVYEARPWQCRTWPFWPENMHAAVWEHEVCSWCPGAGRGRLYTAREIEEILTKKQDVSGIKNGRKS
jgi:Fe-S-cluster containining protein